MKKVMFETMKKLAAVFLVIWNIISIPIKFVIGLIIGAIALLITLIEVFVFGKTVYVAPKVSGTNVIDYMKEKYTCKREAIRRILTYDHNMTDFKYDFRRAL